MSRSLLAAAANAASGAAALSYTFADTADLERVIFTLDAAATTSENLTITLDANAGAAFDAAIRTVDLAVKGGTVFEWVNLGRFVTGDKITLAFANTDANAWSAQFYIDISAGE